MVCDPLTYYFSFENIPLYITIYVYNTFPSVKNGCKC